MEYPAALSCVTGVTGNLTRRPPDPLHPSMHQQFRNFLGILFDVEPIKLLACIMLNLRKIQPAFP